MASQEYHQSSFCNVTRRGAANPRRAFTIWDLLIVIIVLAMLLAMMLPILRKVRDDGMVRQSMANLQALALSHSLYGADHNGNQWTVIPHNLAEFGDSLDEAPCNYNKALGQPCSTFAQSPAFKIGFNGQPWFELGWGCHPSSGCSIGSGAARLASCRSVSLPPPPALATSACII